MKAIDCATGNAKLNLDLGGGMNPLQQKAYDAVSVALPFAIDSAKITVEPGLSYLPSPIKLPDYAVGVMAAFGSVVEHLGARIIIGQNLVSTSLR
jgi:hypothetical protein